MVFQGTAQQAGDLGIGYPMRHRQLADKAQHPGQVLALRPVVGDLGLEIVE
jgi:hypothetical protein